MGKLVAVKTTEGLLELIEKSGVLAPKQLEQAKLACSESTDLKTAARRLITEKVLTLWQTKQLVAGFAGLKLGKYRLLDELGSGSLGRVYLAEHMQLGRRVAIKMLARRHADNQDSVKKFLARAREIAALDHRNLIHVYDVGSESDRYFIVTEFAEGKDLEKMVATAGKLPLDRAAEILRQAAEGLAYAHSNQMFHLDLKPTNLLVDSQETVKILDTGVAQLNAAVDGTADDASTVDDHTAGNFFVAPEVRNQPTAGNAQSDVFSLGALFYFMVTGQPPMAVKEGDSWVRSNELTPLTKLRPDAAPALVELCESMMHEDVAARPDSLADVAAAAAKWLESRSKPAAAPASRAAEPTPAAKKPEAKSTPAAAAAPAAPAASAAAKPSPSPKTEGAPSKAAAPPVRKPLAKAKLLAAKSIDGQPGAEESSDAVATAAAPIKPSQRVLSKGKATETKTIEATDDGSSNNDSSGFGFAVDVKKSTAKKKKAAAAESAPEPEADDAEADVPVSSKMAVAKEPAGKKAAGKKGKSKSAGASIQLPPKKILIIGGSAAAALLLVVVLGVVYMFSGGDKNKDVAKAEESPIELADDAANKTDEPKTEGEEKTDGEKKDETETKPDGEMKSDGELKTTEPVVADDAKKPDAADTANVVATPDTNAAPPPVPMPMKTEPEKKPDAVASAAPVSPPKPPPPKPVVEPFKGFPSFIELPSLGTESAPNSEAMNPIVLGEVKIDKKALCIMHLLGSDKTFKGSKQKFAIEAGDSGVSLRDWDIFYREEAAETGGSKVATLSLKEDKLSFQWLPDAQTQKNSIYLSNCVLSMVSGGAKPHYVAFRKPIERDPITLEFGKASFKESLKIPLPPDPSKIDVRLYVDGIVAKHSFQPLQKIGADKGATLIGFGETEVEMPLKLKVESALLAREIELKFDPSYQVGQMQRPEKLTAKVAKSLTQQAELETQKLNLQANAARNAAKSNGPQKKAAEDFLAQAVERGKTLEQMRAQAEQVKSLVESISGNGKLHFEVVYAAEGKELVLMTTNPPEQKIGGPKRK